MELMNQWIIAFNLINSLLQLQIVYMGERKDSASVTLLCLTQYKRMHRLPFWILCDLRLCVCSSYMH